MDYQEDFPISILARIFPPMDDYEYKSLVTSIREVGQLEPIYVWRGKIVDGQHQLRACREAGVQPRFEILPDDVDPFQFVMAKNHHRRHLNTSQKAVVAYKASSMSLSELYGTQEGEYANLHTKLTQKQAAKLFGVSLRSVANARVIFGPDSTAAPELQRAVERGIVAVSAAAGIVKAPQGVQKEAIERVVAGKSTTLASAVRRITRDAVRGEAAPGSGQSRTPLQPPVFFQFEMADLMYILPETSVDAIITRPPFNEGDLTPYRHLADFAVQTLKEDGVMAVMVDSLFLPPIMRQFQRPALHWVCEMIILCHWPQRVCNSRHQLTLFHRPLLIYGKSRFSLSGPNIIRVPSPGDSATDKGPLRGLDAALALVVGRFTRPGQTVCDPFIQGRGGTAFGALSQGCAFIGGDPYEENLVRTRKFLEKAGLGCDHAHGTSPTLF